MSQATDKSAHNTEGYHHHHHHEPHKNYIPKIAQHSPIQQFYAHKTIFLTGATGFLGKAILEKILRTCSEVKTIYVLLRPKKGNSAKERLNQLIQNKIFDAIRPHQHKWFPKIHAIHGDLMEPELGISPEDKALLCDEVQIVFHSAATVRFTEPMYIALKMNLEGCVKMLQLAHGMSHLQSYIHVSTAYSNCNLNEIQEKIYAPPIDPQKLLDCLTWMNDAQVNLIGESLLTDHPNTYTYTKQLAEHVVREFSHQYGMKMAIVRPAIITGANEEPYPGWVDGYNGPTGLMVAISKGLLHTMVGKDKANADIVPVDMVANSILAAAWKLGSSQSSSESGLADSESETSTTPSDPEVYNMAGCETNKLTWGNATREIVSNILQFPVQGCILVPHFSMTPNVWLYTLRRCVYQDIPAALFHLITSIIGHRLHLWRINVMIRRNVESLSYFTSRNWRFHTPNMRRLLLQMSPADQKLFNFDTSHIHWGTYVRNSHYGVKRFILKEDISKTDMTIKRMKRFQMVFFLVRWSLIIFVGVFFMKKRFTHVWRILLTALRLLRSLLLLITNNRWTSNLFSYLNLTKSLRVLH